MRALLLASLVLVGCGDEEAKTYPTYQACFDDKTEKQSEKTVDAVVACCLDHEIGGAMAPHCGPDESTCINYLTANLSQTDADIQIRTQSCQAYLVAKAKQ